MSGYRSLHREQVLPEDTALWSCHATPLLTTTTTATTATTSDKNEGRERWRIWTGSSDGCVRSYVAQSPAPSSSADGAGALNASALQLHCSHLLTGPRTASASASTPTTPAAALGCSAVHAVRNYAGDDTEAGDCIVAALELAGRVRLWKFAADWDDKLLQQPQETTTMAADSPKVVPCLAEFTVDHATGTTLQLAPPRIIASVQEVVVAVGCLDGTIAIVSTGIATPNAAAAGKEPSAAGTVLDTWGSPGSATPLSLAWHSTRTETLVVGRQDGVVDLVASSHYKKNQHRLLQLAVANSPCRAVAFTPDGQLLVAGNDAGMLCVWDVNRSTAAPVLVHHVLRAHANWILRVECLSDSRRLLTLGTDRRVHVWSVGQMAQNQPLHTFQLDHAVWTAHILQHQQRPASADRAPRLVAGSDTGWLQVFSLES